ncbi:MAG: HNH endonuclease [Chloroflexi bacterium]|nr:HNH endonuclease [Chloroflexota bacterium]
MFNFFDEEPDRPRRRKAIPKAVKDAVWTKYIGTKKAEGPCYVCGRTIHMSTFHAGHNKAQSKGGKDSIGNLRPICATCNTSMGTTSIEVFKRRHFESGSKTAGKRNTAKAKSAGPSKAKAAPKKRPKRKTDLEKFLGW